MSTAAAVVLFVGILAYALFGGADFGAGFWDLVAGGPSTGERPRSVIEHAIGPVWEANHVWLIFSFVVLWTCFPEAYASITLTLFVPLSIAALGIVLARIGVRVPQGGDQDEFPPELRRGLRGFLDPRAVLLRRRDRSDRVGAGAVRWTGGRPVEQLDQPDVDPRRRDGGDHGRLPRVRVSRVGRAAPLRREHGGVLPAPRGGGGHRRRGRRGRRDHRSPSGRAISLRWADVESAARS